VRFRERGGVRKGKAGREGEGGKERCDKEGGGVREERASSLMLEAKCLPSTVSLSHTHTPAAAAAALSPLSLSPLSLSLSLSLSHTHTCCCCCFLSSFSLSLSHTRTLSPPLLAHAPSQVRALHHPSLSRTKCLKSCFAEVSPPTNPSTSPLLLLT